MTFRGTFPYGTPGGFPGDVLVADIDPDVREADGKAYVAFLLINGAIWERKRGEIETIVRVIGEGGVAIVAIVISEGDISAGSVIDSALTELRLGSQDFVVQQISPGINLVTLERNPVKLNANSDNNSQSTTSIATDLLCAGFTVALPTPSASTWEIVAFAETFINTGGGTITTHLELVHSGGTILGGTTGISTGIPGFRTDRLYSSGVVTGNQTITFNIYAQQSAAGTLQKLTSKILVIARRES